MKQFISHKENKDFKRLYYRGKSFVDPCFVMYVAKGRARQTRLGVTVGKKVGCAVYRNRAKRLLRAAFSTVSENIVSGYDFVFVARTRILTKKSYTIANSIEKHLKAAGVWRDIPSIEQDADMVDKALSERHLSQKNI
ncbi:MAG: ribonuclease P protein component [Clostridia bacterium]|nr:ribonuclease P protein component [Clostridia bacterium]